ncbi:MAG: hypothetical protein KC466_14940, partial [Myxococcales bacterium]|nr:hypothetical protein [Myxococcales bacterium]
MTPRPRLTLGLAAALVAVASLAAAADDEPPLPEGLGTPASEEPALPIGLAGSEEPELPAGLGGAESETALPEGLGAETTPRVEGRTEEASWSLPFDWSGFVESRAGVRTQDDPHERRASLGEARAQLKLERAWPGFAVRTTGDLLYDGVRDHHRVNLETGAGLFDLREAFAFARPSDFLDVKVGRQILTWGTGDLLFINDLFP